MSGLSQKTQTFLSNRKPNGKQREFFDEHASQWDSMNHHEDDKMLYIVGLLGLRGDERILDAGTGTGIMIPYYLERIGSGKVTAVDFSPRMIEEASGKYPPSERLEYLVSDVCCLEPSGSFDLAVCYSCFPHFPDPRKAISSLAGTLRTGGRLVIAHSSSKDHINDVHRCGGEEISNDYLPDADVMAELFAEQGLETVFSRDDEDYYIVIGRKGRY